jgi:hypothetical protein
MTPSLELNIILIPKKLKNINIITIQNCHQTLTNGYFERKMLFL